MSDLVERLREIAHASALTSDYRDGEVVMGDGNHSEIICVMEEAAAELTRLREEKSAANNEWRLAYNACAEERDTLRSRLAALESPSEDMVDAVGNAFREGMRGALEVSFAAVERTGKVQSANDAMMRGGARAALLAVSKHLEEKT